MLRRVSLQRDEHEEAHQPPTESVVYFRSGGLTLIQSYVAFYINCTGKTKFAKTVLVFQNMYKKSHSRLPGTAF